ncbi:MAG TPA: type II secretion system F family protein [Candidatus Paceibacterota bacterium]|nr:type II secretion system F family protein [Candidatus Paceibacterota bacterium]HRY76787.1 type II secretion system F family protein [Candidatus Paceibacterota bacterium]
MAKFRYSARNELGETQAGMVEAASRDLAIKILQENKLYLLSLESLEKKNVWGKFSGLFQKVKPKELMLFTRQLSTLLSAKVALSDSLKTLHKQISTPALKDVIFDVYTDVDGGLYFSQALSKHPKVFSDFYVNMVRSAEVSGRLEETLLFMADYLEKEMRLSSRVKSAMIYPVFVIGIFIAVMILILTVVMPQMRSIFSEVNVQLPFLTRVLMGLGTFMSSWGWALLIVLVVAVVVAVRYFRSDEGKPVWDELTVGIPLFGTLIKKTAITRFATSTSVLLKGGISVTDSLEISARVVSNQVYRRVLNETAEEIRRGGTISASLSRYPEYFPPLVTQMVAIGETSGQLDTLLDKVSSFYNEEVQNSINNLVEMVQPAIIVVLGLFIGLFVGAVLLPIYNLASVF